MFESRQWGFGGYVSKMTGAFGSVLSMVRFDLYSIAGPVETV
jgi:hypothetical protein